MKITKIYPLILALALVFTACERVLMAPNPGTDSVAVFDEYATLVKEKYAMLEFKGVDIETLSDSIRATINEDTSPEELFAKLATITLRLRDGHTVLIEDQFKANTLFAAFDLEAGYSTAFDYSILFNNYINSSTNPSIKTLEQGQEGLPRAVWGTLPQDNEIGYLWIPSWDIFLDDSELETIFSDLKDTKGMIVDQRQNGGGDPALATRVASYFTNETLSTGFERFKTGPGPNDFTDSPLSLEPANSTFRYLKPVAVLTDRLVYSASTTFLYSVDPLDRVFTVGQRSGGGSGSVADGYLANGWYWSMSTSEFIDARGRNLDDGLDPDIPVTFDPMDLTRDEIIERAIQELQ